MYGVFSTCYELTTLDVSNWNTSKAIDISDIFGWDFKLETVKGLDKWDTSNVVYMDGVFDSCHSLSLECLKSVEAWNTKNVENMKVMFAQCYKLTKIDLSKWDTSNVTNMWYMFCNSGISDLNVSTWDTHNVTNMGGMFSNCDGLTVLDISSWDTSNVKIFGSMFWDCDNLTTIKGVIDMKSADKDRWHYETISEDPYNDKLHYTMFGDSTKRNLKGVKIKNPPADFETYCGLNKDQYEIVE